MQALVAPSKHAGHTSRIGLAVITCLFPSQDVQILVEPVPRIVSKALVGIGTVISKLIRLKVRSSHCGSSAW